MLKHVYLGGPIEGLPLHEVIKWRKEAADFYFKKLQGDPHIDAPWVKTIDPCRRKAFHDEPYSENLAKKIVQLDTDDIARSDLVLCNLKDRGAGKAWGSVMELVIAHQLGTPVITILEEGFNHPFVRVYSTEIHHTLEDGLNASLGYFQ